MRAPMALRPFSYFWAQFVKTWIGDISTTFFTPLLFLASIGAGLGSLIGHGEALPSLGGENYLSFVAPALLAATAMQVAIARATYDVFGYCNYWTGAYRSMQASPIGISQIVTGQLAWIGVRALLASALFLPVSAAFGAVRSPAAALDLVVGPLVGLAFATPIAAYAVLVRHDQPFTIIFRLLMAPLFLFSGMFFPITQLPVGLRYLAYAMPLWHGTELSRDCYYGHFHVGADIGHLCYLIGVALMGAIAARATFRRRLAR